MCVSLSLYYDVKFGGSHYVMHFLVLIFYRYINYMCAFKLPVDQEYAIRQSFAAFLLLTPLFFSEFLGSRMAANGGQCLSGFAWTMLFLNNIFEKKRTEAIVPICSVDTGDPVAPGVGDRGLSPIGGATGPPSFFFSRDFVANLKKKYI